MRADELSSRISSALDEYGDVYIEKKYASCVLVKDGEGHFFEILVRPELSRQELFTEEEMLAYSD